MTIASIQYNEHTCAFAGCGIIFFISTGFEDRRRKDKKNFYCPNGHPLAYTSPTEEELLRKQLREKDSRIGILLSENTKLRRRPKPRKKA